MRRVFDLLSNESPLDEACIARLLRLDTSAVRQCLQALRECGVEIETIPACRYRLKRSLPLLEKAHILEALGPAPRKLLKHLECRTLLDSTNTHLLRLSPEQAHRRAVLAECQIQGRGQKDHRWISPPAAGLYLSVGWLYPMSPVNVHVLSTASAVSALGALQALGIARIGLKWPNDLMHQGRKVGGVLMEIASMPGNRCRVVVGIGLNISFPKTASKKIDQPWTDLTHIAGKTPCRNLLAAALLDKLLPMLSRYPHAPLAETIETWKRHDCMRGKMATLKLRDRSVHGTVLEIDTDGLLRMEVSGVTRKFSSGELRLQAAH